jgi:hypothetical protein
MALADQLTTQEKGVIQQFKEEARKFWNIWTKLDQQKMFVAKQSPEVQQEYNELMNRGSSIRSTIETVTGAIDKAAAMYDSVKTWLMERFGFSEIEADNQMQIGGLGIAPLVAIGGAAAISAGVAAITAWVTDAWTVNKRLEEIRRLEAQGIPPEKAAEIVGKTIPAPTGLFGDLGKLAVPLMLVAAAIFIVPQLTKQR